jgi:hypothetical protein
VNGILLEYAATDFRADAVARSSRLLSRTSIPIDVADLSRLNFSVCLPSPGDSFLKRQFLAMRIRIFLATSFGLLLLSLSLLGLSQLLQSEILFAAGMIVGLLGETVSFFVVKFHKWILRSAMRSAGVPKPPFKPTERIRILNIENPATCKNPKIVTEDHAVLYCDSARRLIVMEGLFNRYLIRARDVIRVTPKRTLLFSFILVEFNVGGESLTVALSSLSFVAELRRMLSLGLAAPPFAKALQRTLSVPIPYHLQSSQSADQFVASHRTA